MQANQLPLCVTLRDDAIFDNFFVGQNAQLIDALKNFMTHNNESLIVCYGESGSGRTHLLQACCHEVNKKNKSLFYLPFSNLNELSVSIFESLEDHDCICMDDVDAIAGNAQWEEALFHFYNRARENQVRMIMSANKPPKQLSFALKDLQSRLSAGLILEVKNLNDHEKIEALKMRAQLRGLHLTGEVSHYLIHHFSRNMRDLFLVLEKLDHASLIAKRKLTIPFVKSVVL